MVQVNFSTREGWLFWVLWIHYIYISYHYILVWVKTTTLQVNESSSPWKIFKTCKLTFTKNTPNSNPLLFFLSKNLRLYIYSHFCAAIFQEKKTPPPPFAATLVVVDLTFLGQPTPVGSAAVDGGSQIGVSRWVDFGGTFRLQFYHDAWRSGIWWDFPLRMLRVAMVGCQGCQGGGLPSKNLVVLFFLSSQIFGSR